MAEASSNAPRPPRRIIPIEPDGWRFILPSAALTGLLFWLQLPFPALGVGLVAFFILFFFRDPERPLPPGESNVSSPADGHVTMVEEVEHPDFPGGRCLKIGIFLSVLDVHVNRMPLAGKVLDVTHTPGKFLNAMNPESVKVNERCDIRMETAFGPMIVRQIAGLIARRIVCRAQKGRDYARGERFGLIRFGSGTEIYLPLPAAPKVKPKQFVRCGQTVLAVMGEE